MESAVLLATEPLLRLPEALLRAKYQSQLVPILYIIRQIVYSCVIMAIGIKNNWKFDINNA